mgnify:CR=1 FL=1
MPQEKLLLIPGPTPVHPRIIHSLSQPTVSHVSPIMVTELKQAQVNLTGNARDLWVTGIRDIRGQRAVLDSLSGQVGEDASLVFAEGHFPGDQQFQCLRRHGATFV